MALLVDDPHSDAARQHRAEAGAALLAGASAGDPGIGDVLRPDPDDAGAVTWTVACYQIGDLSPTTLKDFTDPNEAVRAVAQCPEIAHVAAELLASTASGLRWTALVRTGELLNFQLVAAGSGPSGASDPSGRLLEAAQQRWAAALGPWAASPAPAPAPSWPPSWPQSSPAPTLPSDFGLAMGQLLEAVHGLARRVDDLVTAREVMDRLSAVEQRLVEIQVQLALASVPAPHRPDFAPIDAQASTGRLLPAELPYRPHHRAEPARPLAKRLSEVISRAAVRGLAAARHQQPSIPPIDRDGDGRGSG